MKKPFLGVLIALKKDGSSRVHMPYFGGALSQENGKQYGLKLFKELIEDSNDWTVTYNDAQEMTPEEYREAVEGINL